MENLQHFAAPDLGVLFTDLYIFDSRQPGTGALLANVQPQVLPDREVVCAQAPDLAVELRVLRDVSAAEVTLRRAPESVPADHQVFALAEGFFNKFLVQLSILFEEWKIVAVIDGKPLPVKRQGLADGSEAEIGTAS